MHIYYCKNGEQVFVNDDPYDPNLIDVYYRGKKYKRHKTCLGRTLFARNPKDGPYRPAPKITMKCSYYVDKTGSDVYPDQSRRKSDAVQVNSKIILLNLCTNETVKAVIIPSQQKNLIEYQDGCLLIADRSSIGRAVIGKLRSETVRLTIRKTTSTYKITSIDNGNL